ncbi:MAG: hypothetical protein ACUVRG_02310 [Ignavibacterium sp.]|uniref:hypothetical protein n=1 Tax=Ignavibacterium sp. TaxID=2651167 RepID=UPI00404B1ED1
MKELFEILRYRLFWLNIFLLIISALMMFHYHFLSLITFALLINLYDILGYHFTLIRRSAQLPDKIIIRAYRVHQLLFEILFMLFIAFVIGLKYAISCSIIK